MAAVVVVSSARLSEAKSDDDFVDTFELDDSDDAYDDDNSSDSRDFLTPFKTRDSEKGRDPSVKEVNGGQLPFLEAFESEFGVRIINADEDNDGDDIDDDVDDYVDLENARSENIDDESGDRESEDKKIGINFEIDDVDAEDDDNFTDEEYGDNIKDTTDKSKQRSITVSSIFDSERDQTSHKMLGNKSKIISVNEDYVNVDGMNESDNDDDDDVVNRRFVEYDESVAEQDYDSTEYTKDSNTYDAKPFEKSRPTLTEILLPPPRRTYPHKHYSLAPLDSFQFQDTPDSLRPSSPSSISPSQSLSPSHSLSSSSLLSSPPSLPQSLSPSSSYSPSPSSSFQTSPSYPESQDKHRFSTQDNHNSFSQNRYKFNVKNRHRYFSLESVSRQAFHSEDDNDNFDTEVDADDDDFDTEDDYDDDNSGTEDDYSDDVDDDDQNANDFHNNDRNKTHFAVFLPPSAPTPSAANVLSSSTLTAKRPLLSRPSLSSFGRRIPESPALLTSVASPRSPPTEADPFPSRPTSLYQTPGRKVS